VSKKEDGSQGSNLDREAIIGLARKMAENDQPRQLQPNAPARQRRSDKTDFTTLKMAKNIEIQRSAGAFMGLKNPYFQLHEGRAGATTMIDGREYINFAAYDYLGLNAHPDVTIAANEAINRYGTSVSASRPTSGDRPLHRKLERQIADLYGAEDALTFVSGHSTNVSTIGDLMGPGDLILFDALSHNSITVGTDLSGATRRRFGHNDLNGLTDILREMRHKYDRVLIVVEGLYSMDGDIPDLGRLIEIKKRFDAWLMVDEAHAVGVLGRSGRGLFEHCDAAPRDVDIWMGTLSKTLAGCGGYIAGCNTLIEILRYQASGFMFSVGMSPPVAAASSRALELMLAEPERVRRLQDNGRFFMETARDAGLDTGLALGFAIIPVIVGDSLRTVKLANLLMEAGIFTIPVTFPAVGEKTARIRFFITSEHSREQMEFAIATTAKLLGQLVEDNFGLMSAAIKPDGAGELE